MTTVLGSSVKAALPALLYFLGIVLVQLPLLLLKLGKFQYGASSLATDDDCQYGLISQRMPQQHRASRSSRVLVTRSTNR